MIKNILRSLTPAFVRDAYWKFRRDRQARQRDRLYGQMSVGEAFSHIYQQRPWAGDAELSSGRGSSHPGIVEPYVSAVSSFLESLPRQQRTIVDLGCGNFKVGARFIDLCSSYQAIDVVPAVIEALRAKAFPSHVSFHCADILVEPLPAGRVCFVRQVLQHLSNAQIAQVLPKLRQFDYVIITEHYPSAERFVAPNLDKVHGPGIRLEKGSAVCLDQPPFNIPRTALQLLVEVPGDGSGQDAGNGVIRTFLVRGTAIPLQSS